MEMMQFWGSLNKYDRVCRKCKLRKPLKGGRIVTIKGRQAFTCAECK